MKNAGLLIGTAKTEIDQYRYAVSRFFCLHIHDLGVEISAANVSSLVT